MRKYHTLELQNVVIKTEIGKIHLEIINITKIANKKDQVSSTKQNTTSQSINKVVETVLQGKIPPPSTYTAEEKLAEETEKDLVQLQGGPEIVPIRNGRVVLHVLKE